MGTPFKMGGFSGFGNSPLKQEETTTEQKKETTDEGRAAYLAEKGITSAELSKELNRLAELHGDDDIDYSQWKSVVDSLSAAKQPK